jgi:hypothetical protein
MLGEHLYPVAVGLLTLAPLVSHARHVGIRNVLGQPSVVTVIVWFYLAVFPLRGLMVAASAYNDLVFLRGPINGRDLASMLLLASASTTVLVESYYFLCKGRRPQPRVATEPADRHRAVVRLACLLSLLSLAGIFGVIVEHGGIAGARAAFLQHTVTAALQGNSSVFASAWQLFAVPSIWVSAYVVFNPGSSRTTRWSFGGIALLTIAGAIWIYSSRLSTVLGLVGVWVVFFYSGRRIPGKLIGIVLLLAVLLSQPILSTRQGRIDSSRVSTAERYSRIAGYGVLDTALAIQSQPGVIRHQLKNPNRWLDLPAYLVPSQLWHGRPNLNARRLVLYAARDVGAANDRASGLPSTYITEGWLLGGWAGALGLSVIFGLVLGWGTERLTRSRAPSPAAVLSLAFLVTSGWSYYESGDVVVSIVGQGRMAIYLLLLLWVTGVVRRRDPAMPTAARASPAWVGLRE